MNKKISKNAPVSLYEKIIKQNNWPLWPYFNSEDYKSVYRVIKSNMLFASGDSKGLFKGSEVGFFEKEYAKYMGSKYARAVGNGTQGLHLALTSLDIGINDEVITTPFTWISSASCILMQNAIPVFSDIESETLGLCPYELEKNITKKTKAVILVHMFGYSAKVDEILKICKKNKIALIEDASHVHGAEFKGKKLGTYGEIGVFSLHQRKNLSVGDGGIVVTNKKNIADRIYRLRSFGDEELSYNYRMTEFAGALGRSRLKRLNKENLTRAKNADYLRKKLKKINFIKVRSPIKNTKAVYYALLLEFDKNYLNLSLEKFIDLLRSQGIPVNKSYTPLHRHPHFNPKKIPARGSPWLFKNKKVNNKNLLNYNNKSYPVAENFSDNILLELPVHPPISFREMDKVVKAIDKIKDKYKK